MDMAKAFDKVVAIANDASDAAKGWNTLLQFSKKHVVIKETDPICILEMPRAVDEVMKRLGAIIGKEPIPSKISFLYFGLFDAWSEKEKKKSAGYYVSGGERYLPEEPDCLCGLPYFPNHRFIRSRLLDGIMGFSEANPDHSQFIEYAMMLGGAALLTKFTVSAMRLPHKIIVGFDEGDFAEIS